MKDGAGKASGSGQSLADGLLRQDPARWLAAHPEVETVHAVLCDLNGVLRGKRLPAGQIEKVVSGGLRMPLSATCPDIWGADVADNPMVFEEGDADGVCLPTGRGIFPVDWLKAPGAILPVWMQTEAGAPHAADPRQALAAIVSRFAALGLRPVVASELEFYFLDPQSGRPAPPRNPVSGRKLDGSDMMSLADLDAFEPVLADIFRACARCGIPADAVLSENGTGQFEINLKHSPDALRAADDTVYFKHIVKGVARGHGLEASFIAKPYLEASGSGFHVHFSLLDREGRNVFDDGGGEGSTTLRHAVGGVLAGMEDCALIFAPHLNSFRRWQPASHAPHSVCWGYDTRHAAVRIPGGPGAARRIEHRVSGSDANPYLVIGAVLGAALAGIEGAIEPPAAMTSPTETQEAPLLPTTWAAAIERFALSAALRRLFSPALIDAFVGMKRQEIGVFSQRMSAFEIETYRERV
ncbi:MAG: glutamine synthetase family protein [Pseudomonadota bacterium]